jgi:hypothetical protein
VHVVALVVETDLDAPVEKGELAQSGLQRRKNKVGCLEYLLVRPEPDGRAGPLVGVEVADPLEVALGLAGLEAVSPKCAVALDLHLEPPGEGVHHRDTDPVEPTRHLIGVAVELPPGVEHRHNHLQCRPVVLLVGVDRNPPAVVDYRHGAVVVDCYLDVLTVARERLVDGVVDNLVDKMMEAAFVRRPDVHRRALLYCLQPFEYLYLPCAVLSLVGHKIV